MKLMTHQKLRTIGGACLLTLLSATVPVFPAAAQMPASAPTALPPKMYSKSPTFNLPIQMKEITRQSLQKVQLWVKTPGGQWCRQDEVAPTAKEFSYRATQDGEYWFNLVTVDKQGRTEPANVSQEVPGLRVIVDSKAPVVDVQLLAGADGECLLSCTMQDTNPDPASLRAFGRGSAGELALEQISGQPGVFRVRAELMNNPVRVTASDFAGNTTTRDVNLKDLYAAAGKPFPGTTPLPVSTGSSVATKPPALDPKVGQSTGSSVAAKPPTLDPKVGQGMATPPTLTPVRGIETATIPAPAVANPPPVAPVISSPKMPILSTESGATVAKAGPANRRLIGTNRASIDYRIDHVGASGVGKVEIYITHDHGNTWRRVGEDADRQSPAEIDLPGEGLFGVRLAITNGNGFGGTPPTRGDQPQCWVEVDTTLPFVQLRPTEVVPNGGALDIRWSASDLNLGAEPVSLFFRGRIDAPWQPIARAIKNEGVYRWAFPRDCGSQFLFKVEVADQAGNIARAESQAPVILDMTEPQASVLSISAMGKTPAAN